MNTTTTEALIVETPRGPSLAGTRITVYSVMDLIKTNRSKRYIEQMMLLTPEQVEAVLAYVEQHQAEVERDYAEILRRSEELRLRYEEQNRARSRFPPEMTWEERRPLMLERLAQIKQAAQDESLRPNRSIKGRSFNGIFSD